MILDIRLCSLLILGFLASCVATVSDISRIEQNQVIIRQDIGRQLDAFEAKVDNLSTTSEGAKAVGEAASLLANNVKKDLDTTTQVVNNVKTSMTEKGMTLEQLLGLILAGSGVVSTAAVGANHVLRNRSSPDRVREILTQLLAEKTT